MATVKKSKKRVIAIVCIVLAIVIAVTSIAIVSKTKNGAEVSLHTISTEDIIETVSLTGGISAGTSKEYKVGTVATVKEVFVEVGDNVKKGDVLATFDVSNLDGQISSLQASYDESVRAYNSAVNAQNTAKSKSAALESEIAKLEKLISDMQKGNAPTTAATVNNNATKVNTTTENATVKNTADKNVTVKNTATKVNNTTENVIKTTYSANELTVPNIDLPTAPSASQPTLSGLADAVDELNQTLTKLTDDIATLTTTTQIIATTVVELSGSLDNEAIADRLVQNLVESGIAESMAKQIVDSIDIDALVNAVANTEDAQLTAAQVQLVSLEAQKAIFDVQADGTLVNAQKKSVNATKQALDILKSQKQDLSAGWVAAFDGTITAVDVTAGVQTTMLSSGITLENLDSMAVKISLGEYDLHKVKVGMAATVTTAYGTYDGEVTSIAPTATGGSSGSILDSVGSMAGISGLSSLTDSGAGVECIISIPETDENIIAGFDANVEIQTGEYLGVTAVPIGSIKLEKDGAFVYLYDAEENEVTKTKIEIGASSVSSYQVLSGLNVGDQIVSAPASDYEDDTFKVKVVTK